MAANFGSSTKPNGLERMSAADWTLVIFGEFWLDRSIDCCHKQIGLQINCQSGSDYARGQHFAVEVLERFGATRSIF